MYDQRNVQFSLHTGKSLKVLAKTTKAKTSNVMKGRPNEVK